MLRKTVVAAAVALSALTAGTTLAQDYPNKPIDFVVTFAAGGSSDILARLAAEKLERELGQPVNVINTPGGAHIPGVMKVLEAPADGYTLLRWNTPSAVVNPIVREIPYDPLTDIIPIFADATTSNVLYVRGDSDITTIEEFVAAAKEKTMLMGINNVGAPPHLSAVQLGQEFDVEFKYLTLKTVPATVTGLVGGQVDAAIGQLPQQSAFGDEVRAIAVLDKRWPHTDSYVPGVPTISEVYPDVTVGTWIYGGMGVKAGTPQDVVDRLVEAANTALDTKEYADAVNQRSTFVWISGPDEVRTIWTEGQDLYRPLLEGLGMAK